jgi:hypothetical protein
MWLYDVPFNGTLLTTQQHLLRFAVQIILIITAIFLSGDLHRLRATLSTG